MKVIQITVNGEPFILRHDNCVIYRFRANPFMDHAYYEDEERAFFVFGREDLLATMEEYGHTLVVQQYPPEKDIDAYLNWADDNTDWSEP